MTPVRPEISSMKGYVPGLQPDPAQRYIKLNSNENPFPPSPRVKEALARLSYEDLRFYPDPMSLEIRTRLGALYGCRPEQIICGNGSDDVLNIVMRTFARPGDAVGFYEPTFPLYRILAVIHGVKAVAVPVAEPYDSPPAPPVGLKVFFLANPNSPVGFAYPTSFLADLARNTEGILVVDEAYAEFACENALGLLRDLRNVIVVRTLSKSYALAGARLGYAVGDAAYISEMFKVKDPFNVTRLTQAVVSAALEDQDYFRKMVARIMETREAFARQASGLGYRIIPSQANFIFPRPPQQGRGVKFFEALFQRRVLTRYYDDDGLRDGVRMTIGTDEEMAEALQVMKEILPEFSRS